MVGRYKYAGKEVSEKEFKAKVYGKDSGAYRQAVESEKRARKRNYTRVTKRDGSVVDRPKNEASTSKDVLVSKAPQPTEKPSKNTLIIGVDRSGGRPKVENLGAYLTESQRREVIKLNNKQGRLTSTISEPTKTAIGSTTTLTFTGGGTSTSKPTIEPTPNKTNPLGSGGSDTPPAPFAPYNKGKEETPDINDAVDTSGLFSYAPPEPDTLKEARQVSRYEKTKFILGEKLFKQGDTEPITTQEGLTFVPAAVETIATAGFDFGKGFVIGGVVGTARALTVDLDQTLTGVTDIITGKTSRRDIMTNLNTALVTDPAYFAGELGFVVAAPTIVKGVFAGGGRLTAEFSKLSPKYRPVVLTEGGQVIEGIPRYTEGSINAKTISVTKAGVIDKTPVLDTFNIGVAGGVSSTAESLAKQAQLAGTTTDAVSGQRSLFNIFKKKLTVDKPNPSNIPQEEFYFADPRGRIRTSRLGLTPEDITTEASFKDLFSGNVKLFERPQIVVQEQVTIADFPANLQIVKSKLLKGQPLTTAERTALLEFQQTVTGEFKPIGFVGSESEITLAKGETLFKTGTQATTVIEGRRVPIISTIIKPVEAAPTGNIKALTQGSITPEAYAGEVTSSQSKLIGSSTFRPVTSTSSTVTTINAIGGFPSSSSSSSGSGLITPPSIITSEGSSSGSSGSKTITFTSTSSSSSSSSVTPSGFVTSGSSRSRGRSNRVITSPSSPSSVSDSVSITSPSSSSSTSSISIIGSAGSSGSSRPSIRYPPVSYVTPYAKARTQRQRRGAGFDVLVRRRGRFEKITRKGLTYGEALDFGAYRVTNTAAATFTLVPSSTSGGTLTKRAKGAFGFTSANLFKKGGLFIEKREKRIKKSSAGEKAEITAKGIASSKNKRRLKIL